MGVCGTHKLKLRAILWCPHQIFVMLVDVTNNMQLRYCSHVTPINVIFNVSIPPFRFKGPTRILKLSI
jgi:hypothetical protein